MVLQDLRRRHVAEVAGLQEQVLDLRGRVEEGEKVGRTIASLRNKQREHVDDLARLRGDNERLTGSVVHMTKVNGFIYDLSLLY